MRKTIKLLSLLASFVLAGSLSPALAQTTAATAAATPTATTVPTPAVTVDGLVDIYYTYNFNAVSGAGNFNPAAPGLSGNSFYNFNTTNNSFALGLAEVNVTAKMGEASFHTVVGYGQAVSIVGFPSPIMQAYAEWVTGNLTLDAGQMVTPMGEEVIESKSNWNYSRSFLFSYAIPYYHTGLHATYVFDPKYFTANAAVYDGWNSTFAGDASGQKSYHLMLTGTPDPSLTLNVMVMYGPIPAAMAPAYAVTAIGISASAMRSLWEANATWNATDKLSFAADYNMGTDDSPDPGLAGDVWSGLAGYARYQIQGDWAVAGRGEEFVDHHGALLGLTSGAALWEGTLTLEHTISTNLLVRLEGRYDWAADPNSGNAINILNNGKANQLTSTLSAVYSF